MPLVRGLLWDALLRPSAFHPETLVFLAAADDGRALLLRRGLLHSSADVSVSAQRGARLQCVLHQTARQHASLPTSGHARLRRPLRRHDDDPDPRLPGSDGSGAHDELVPAAALLLQPPAALVRAGVQERREEEPQRILTMRNTADGKRKSASSRRSPETLLFICLFSGRLFLARSRFVVLWFDRRAAGGQQREQTS